MPQWRDELLPASFRGVEFHVDVSVQASGRRIVAHEFIRRDAPHTEDFGRRGRKFQITAYVIGDDYKARRNALERALETEGPGILVHPTRGQARVRADNYSVRETRERGGIAEFDIVFYEAGDALVSTAATGSVVRSAAGAAAAAAVQALDSATAPVAADARSI